MRLALFLLVSMSVLGADPAGKWNLTAVTDSGKEHRLVLTLKNDGAKWTGDVDSQEGAAPLNSIEVKDSDVSFKIATGDTDYELKLKLDGDTLKGTFSGSNGKNGNVTGVRAGAGAAAVAGTWQVTGKLSSGRVHEGQLTLRVQDGALGGNFATADGEVGLQNVKLAGSELSFDLTSEDGTYKVKLVVTGNALTGTVAGPGSVTGTVSGSR